MSRLVLKRVTFLQTLGPRSSSLSAITEARGLHHVVSAQPCPLRHRIDLSRHQTCSYVRRFADDAKNDEKIVESASSNDDSSKVSPSNTNVVVDSAMAAAEATVTDAFVDANSKAARKTSDEVGKKDEDNANIESASAKAVEETGDAEPEGRGTSEPLPSLAMDAAVVTDVSADANAEVASEQSGAVEKKKKKKKKKGKKDKENAITGAATTAETDGAEPEGRWRSDQLPSLADDAAIIRAAEEVAKEAAPTEAEFVVNDLLQFLREPAPIKEPSPQPDPAPAAAAVSEAKQDILTEVDAPNTPTFDFLMEMMMVEDRKKGFTSRDAKRSRSTPRRRSLKEESIVSVSRDDPLADLETALTSTKRASRQIARRSPSPVTEEDTISVEKKEDINLYLEEAMPVKPASRRAARRFPKEEEDEMPDRRASRRDAKVSRSPITEEDTIELAQYAIPSTYSELDQMEQQFERDIESRSQRRSRGNVSRRRGDDSRTQREIEGHWASGEVAFEPLAYQLGNSGMQGSRKPGLGIFVGAEAPDPEKTAPFHRGLDADFKFAEPSLYDRLRDADMRRNLERFPTNGFEEMIKLTKEGKIWKYPIDNEQDIGPEEQVPFTDHVFLDRLTRDFPKTGAARNFIDLVVNGLSRNPDMTVEEKKNYIAWYSDYFKENKLMGEKASAV